MSFESVKKALGETAVKQALRYISTNPEENLGKLMKLGESLAREEYHKEYVRKWAEMFADENNNWRQMVVRLLREIDPGVRDKLLANYFVNAGILCPGRLRESGAKYGIHVPWAILIDPTGRCNLRCKGCWAAEYDRTKDMDFATLDRILTEAEELGIRFFVISGGEPTVRMHDLMRLAEIHDESTFHVFTNGTLITPEIARRFAEIGNVTFAISIEGLEKETDERRGQGVFKKVMAAMDNLREAGVVFGFSATYTRLNTDTIRSDDFIDLMVAKGCRLGWLFTYVPVGGDADIEYMATAEQRGAVYRTVQEWRRTKPIFVADFWNDGEAVGGCIAAGRNYFHINSAGDVEPCAFIHYANVNIKDCSLVEALRSPLFKAYQENQPFNSNLIRPCPLIDNPEWLERMVTESKAHSTQTKAVPPSELRKALEAPAKAWAAVADPLWEETHPKQDANGTQK